MRSVLLAAFGILAVTASATAQSLTLQFNDGLVSLKATNVPVRTILSEWGRLGGTRVVGADDISGEPLTLQLDNVSEAQALEIILRGVAGYMAAPRPASAAGASSYDRILVLATSTAPATTPTANRAGGAAAGTERSFGFRPPNPAPGFDEQPAPTNDFDAVNEPAPFSFPENPFQPAGQPGAFGQPGPFGTPMAPDAPPQMLQFGQGGAVMVSPGLDQQQLPVLQFPTTGAPVDMTAPTGGFGVIGSPTPGVVVQPAPPPGTRPPGGL